ncbi:MAG: mechanosensitive ion channel [Hyphomonadaceae bacterium]
MQGRGPIPERKHKPVRINWLRRFRTPAVIAVLGAACVLAVQFAPGEWLNPHDAWVLSIAANVFFVFAGGWLISTFVDGILKSRLGQLQLDQPDNLSARKVATRLDVVRRVWVVIAGTITLAAALTVIPGVKQIGVSLFASAGIAGIAIGFAARPMLGNLIAGLQIAFTQPIRIEDAVVVEGEWGWIEEIGLFKVVIRLWDWRRLVVPPSYFIEQPFQNWTRQSASIIGTVLWSLDYRAPIAEMRDKLTEICKGTPLWDGNVVNLQVTEAQGSSITVRALASARNSPQAWDLRCHIREQMILWLQETYPDALPVIRSLAATNGGVLSEASEGDGGDIG